MYFQDNAPYLQGLTKEFWRETLPQFQVFVSEIVLDEIRATGTSSLRKAMEKLIEDFDILEMAEDAVKLSGTYLSYRRLPRADALHLASAGLGDMDFLVTWNLRHLYKRGTQEMVREVNTRFRLPIPTIATPEDFLGAEE